MKHLIPSGAIPGLVPGIPIGRTRSPTYRDGRGKPGHDGRVSSTAEFHCFNQIGKR
ncbi:hypothetical protein CHELA20_51554 [Hyphomicrobiales bacterium]|nr:hypothetical protein CHELA20_51554 [Hyphomicrobiales bacterium]